MRRLFLIAAVLGALGACSSGGGCDGGGSSSGSSGSGAGGGGGGGGGGPSHNTGETVSFQGLGKSAGPPPVAGQAKAAPGTGPAAAALGNSGSAGGAPLQSVICGGFPNLAADCTKDPSFDAVKQKCCPTGQVEQCQAIPGGARLTGRSCTATAK